MFRSNLSAGLPFEILLEIFSHLDPATILSIASVNSQFNTVVHDYSLWKRKLERHFPDRHDQLEGEIRVNWYGEFRKSYRDGYKGLDAGTRSLFSAVKEKDLNRISRLPLYLEVLDEHDSNQFTLLSWAQSSGSQELLDYIYEIATILHTNPRAPTVDTAKKDDKKRTILYWALACRQQHEHVNLLLLQGSGVNEEYVDGARPVLVASEQGLLKTVTYLVDNNPLLLEQVDKFSQTPLLWAASEGQTAMVRYLIGKGANLEAATNDPKNLEPGRTSLYYAVINQYLEIVTLLVNAGAKLDNPVDNVKRLLIHKAAILGNLEIVKILLAKQPDLFDMPDAYGQTPLLWACAKGNTDVVRLCLGKTANVNVKTINSGTKDHGKSALFWAAENGYDDIAALLVTAGAVIDVKLDSTKFQPLHIAAQNGHVEVVKILLAQDISLLEQATSRGETPLSLAAEHGHHETVSYLLTLNANINVTTRWRPDYEDYAKTPLFLAVKNGHHKVAGLLLNAGASANTIAGEEKYKPIHVAAIHGSLLTLITLLEYKPDLIEQTDAHGNTPLILAVRHGHESMVQYLIKKGSNLDAATNESETSNHNKNALHWAVDKRHSGIVILLLKAGAKLNWRYNRLDYTIDLRLNDEARALLDVENYRVSREQDDEYLRSLTMFGITQTFGASKQRKLQAVEKLKDFYFFGKSELPLVQYEYELNNGELGAIYCNLKKR